MGRKSAPTEKPQHNTRKAFHLEWKNASQKIAYMAFEQHDLLFLLGPAGSAKAQPLDSLICTPSGFIKMGELKLMDEVCTPDGLTSEVIGLFPQGEKDVYKVTFDDGSNCECTEDHLWVVSHNVNGWTNKTVDTKYIINNYKNKNGRHVLKIPMTRPVEFKETKNLLISPYVMGLMIGEGGFSSSNLTFTSSEQPILTAVTSNLSEEYQLKKHKTNKYDYRIVKKIKNSKPNIYKEELRHYGLWGHKSIDKFIPSEYLYTSIEKRIALLQGLLDSDGRIDKSGSYCLCTSSKKLATDYCFLVNSLGGNCFITEKEAFYTKNGIRIQCENSFICTTALPNNICPFRLERKLKRLKPRTKYFPRRIITNVQYMEKKECQCILINHPQHLYITNNFIVTHNTHLAVAFACSEILSRKKKKIILTRPIVEAGEKLGYLPGTFEEKINPYLMPIFDCLDTIVGRDTLERNKINQCLEIVPCAYMRGRTFHDSVVILDEAQNATEEQLKLAVTRLGLESKMVVTGDPTQSDLKGDVALSRIVNAMKTVHGIGMVEFNETHIVRHPLVANILAAWPK